MNIVNKIKAFIERPQKLSKEDKRKMLDFLDNLPHEHWCGIYRGVDCDCREET